ncbi:MAG: lipid A biosynthesis acyltransferase [bacterium]|nr:lipid A biosynthesis acyltransferase [bacterium]
MPGNKKWEGRTKGGLTGHKIFVFILKTFGLRISYFFLRFVAFHFLITARSTKTSLRYFRQIHGYHGVKAWRACYQNYYLFGQVLLDKVALLSGIKTNFIIEHEGYEENLKHLKDPQKGSILLSAHVGNWEIAGQKLERLETKFNVLMYDNEVEHMKEFMSKILGQKKFNVIAIRDGDMSHLVQLHEAFRNKELLVMHGDRYLEGAETIEKNFLGKPAKFPAGPFIMAAKFGVPITVVFSMKDSTNRYHFYARKAIEVKRARTREEMEVAIRAASDMYVKDLEEIVKKYPTQWFNFYDFWA